MRRPPVYNADGGSGLPNQDLENRIEFWGEAHGKSAVKCVGRWANRAARGPQETSFSWKRHYCSIGPSPGSTGLIPAAQWIGSCLPPVVS